MLREKRKREASEVIPTISLKEDLNSPRHLHIVQVARAIRTIISVPRASDFFVVRHVPPLRSFALVIGPVDKDGAS